METLVVKSRSKKRLTLIQTLAKELGLKTERSSKKKKVVLSEVTLVSQNSLAEAWGSKEDEKWDKPYSNKKEGA